jgi:hypothetical protein
MVGRGSTGIRRGGAALAVSAALLGLAATASSAQAATVRVGSPLTASFGPVRFANQLVTLVQVSLPEPGTNLRSPVDGTVTSYQVAPSNGTFALQVVRFSGVTAKSLRSSASTPVGNTGISAPIPTHLAIDQGDFIGVTNFGTGDELGGVKNGATYAAWGPPLEDGADYRQPDYAAEQFEIGMGATVRYCQVPALKGLSLRDARAALAAADCKAGKVRKAKKRRKRKVVVSQSVRPGKAISDTAPIDFKVSRSQRG